MANVDELSAARIAAGVAAGDFSAEEVAKASLDAIEARDGEVQAFLEVSAELALDAARATDARRAAGEPLGPMAGVPVAFKDNMHLVGTHTTCASRMLESYESTYTATCVQRLLDAGATPLGKANMDEFAFGSSTETSHFHPTHNPWDLERVPGGSSGGSAAAVAAGEACVSLGSDTGGSIRQPASLCGVVGLKPTYGAVSRYGVVAFGSSLDQVGPFGRRVEDVALAMNALVAGGHDPYDSTSQDCPVDFLEHLEEGVEGLRVGVVPRLMDAAGLDPEVRDAVEGARRMLEGAGAEVVEVDLPHIDAAISAYYVIGPCEAFSNLARFDGVRYGYQEPGCSTLAEQSALSRAHGFGAEAKRRQMLGAYLLASGVYDEYYVPAQKARTLITQDYVRAFGRCDAILMPSAPRTAFRFGEISDPTQMYLSDMYTISCNIAGNGGISVPLGLGAASGLPVSAQLQGPAFKDRVLLRVARALEREVEAAGTKAMGAVAPAFAGRGGEL
ncbi:MAG: Asp-tRNA(Asn)/Glu-tRNA(Gln) amidotransferase subunit GatA [Atopobiaceae bacterium]|jgi:aspartyl-tRNA(Asn)/glutamyl-tRNA(Gln) amidotransferase subunit A|nr:Asp-tRNA(Asn)/Glu-tRNA(Gln) amidotransferase subunit GatA [Atopobiaceae bacterium]MCI1389305.1 Asp-tRNA(Asn)/Glu-tRNA(Gln) amidotransferase subunit GatA [Atopobiaceae bacterium]MCI1432368.1 Asp-tRNA(Asn)/Glu-tRNA(Gln) amidotransferase subunit GatA [Atopobiaceae bacterium]MCI1470826.1 Asp-tRNA(Asn)/Glu-tRNA(Gln) amidotransferase subunit GatA [Atopobiaceae bacterium]